MPYLMQMMGCAVALVGLMLVVWLGFWILVIMAALTAGYWLWLWLIKQGIVNPRPGVSTDTTIIHEETTTIIEGEFEKVEEKKD